MRRLDNATIRERDTTNPQTNPHIKYTYPPPPPPLIITKTHLKRNPPKNTSLQ